MQINNIVAYNSDTTYSNNEIIYYANNVYKSFQDDNNNNPVNNVDAYTPYDKKHTVYDPGDNVTYEGKHYECLKNNVADVKVFNGEKEYSNANVDDLLVRFDD